MVCAYDCEKDWVELCVNILYFEMFLSKDFIFYYY